MLRLSAAQAELPGYVRNPGLNDLTLIPPAASALRAGDSARALAGTHAVWAAVGPFAGAD